jgi:signal-transduction protein with cAMP-binding, CBS, and nucleotidyltransferase domain
MIDRQLLRDAVVCREGDSILEVSRILRDTQYRHLVVLDKKDAPVGIISTVDINNRVVAEGLSPKTAKAKAIMTKGIKTVTEEDSYAKAYALMVEQSTYSIPVTAKGKLIGILEFMAAFKKSGGK